MSNFLEKNIKITEEKNYLKVVSKGERSDFAEVLQNAEQIHSAIQASDKRLILLDYRLTVFTIPHNQAFNLLKVFELKLTEFKYVKIAAIINAKTEEIGSFWASICRKRGFDYKTFQEEQEGEKWLLKVD